MRAAAEPIPDGPDDRLEDEIQVTRIQDSSKVNIYTVRGDEGRKFNALD